MKIFPTLLVNKDITLREIDYNDAERMFALYKDSDVELALPDNFKVNEFHEIYNELNYLKNVFYDNIGIYWVVAHNTDNKLIGTCGINRIDNVNKKCTIGFDLLKEYRGNGFMYQSLLVLKSYIFDTLNLHRIEAYTEVSNLKCQILLEKLNFNKEGHLKDFEIRNGIHQDFYCYALCNNIL